MLRISTVCKETITHPSKLVSPLQKKYIHLYWYTAYKVYSDAYRVNDKMWAESYIDYTAGGPMINSKKYKNSQLLGLLIILCLLDLLLTTAELNLGLIIEINPLMRYLAEGSLLQFMVGKILLTLMCCAVFYKSIEHRLTSFGIRLAVVAYSVVTVFHILGIANELL